MHARSAFRYCPLCGATLTVGEIEARRRSICPECGWIHYAQLKVGAGALIEQDGRLLLLQRARPPFQGCWNLPAGYVEADEHPAEAARREVQEETGLQVDVGGLVNAYYFDDDPRGNGILLVYRCRILGGEPKASDEGLTPTFFPPQRLPSDLAGGGHDQAVHEWRTARLAASEGEGSS